MELVIDLSGKLERTSSKEYFKNKEDEERVNTVVFIDRLHYVQDCPFHIHHACAVEQENENVR